MLQTSYIDTYRQIMKERKEYFCRNFTIVRKMRKEEIFKRYLLFIIGLFVNSLGICFIIKADLGSSPISSLPYTISLKSPISLGTLTFILNLFLIAGQMLILKKDFKKREWLQLPISVLFGIFIDLSMWMISWIHPELYFMKLVVLIVGCAILGLGVSLEVVANVVMLSGEAFVQAISLKKKKEFGMVKICFDTSLMVLAIILSLILYGAVLGVREGTIVAALLVGMFARFYNKRLIFLNQYLGESTRQAEEPVLVTANDNQHFVITIAREYGSGGREIGKCLAEYFGIPYYDKELIEMVAKEKGMSNIEVASREQNIPSHLLYEMIMQDFTAPLERSLSQDDALFVAQSRIIRKFASEGSCIIIGRCADYVLRDFKNCFKVFVHADYDSKLKRIVNDYKEDEAKAQEELKRVDHGRANHYKTYTGRTWDDASNYDLCVNSSLFSIKECSELIGHIVEKKFHVQPVAASDK